MQDNATIQLQVFTGRTEAEAVDALIDFAGRFSVGICEAWTYYAGDTYVAVLWYNRNKAM